MAIYSDTTTSSGTGGVVTLSMRLADDGGGDLAEDVKFDVIMTVQKNSLLALKGPPSTPGNGFKIQGDHLRWMDLELKLSTNASDTLTLKCRLKNCDQLPDPAYIVVIPVQHHADKPSRFFKPEWVQIKNCGSSAELLQPFDTSWIARLQRDVIITRRESDDSDKD